MPAFIVPKTNEVTNKTDTGFTANGNLSAHGASFTVTKRGFCYKLGTSGYIFPTDGDVTLVEETGSWYIPINSNADYSLLFLGLEPGTSYLVCAYCYNNTYSSGNTIVVVTQQGGSVVEEIDVSSSFISLIQNIQNSYEQISVNTLFAFGRIFEEEIDDNLGIVEVLNSGNLWAGQEIDDIINTSDSNSSSGTLGEIIAEALVTVDINGNAYVYDKSTRTWYFENNEVLICVETPESFLAGNNIIDENLAILDNGLVLPTFFGGVAELLFIYDVLVHGWYVETDDSLVLKEDLSWILNIVVEELFFLIDSQINNWSGREIVYESLELWELCQSAELYSKTINESLVVADTTLYSLIVTILEYLGFIELVNAMTSSSQSINESLAFTDSPEHAWTLLINDTLATIDTSSVVILFIKIIQEALGLADTASLIKSLGVTVSDPLTFTETITSQGHFYSVIYDTLAMNCTVELNGEIWECYVLNTPKFHPSVYSGFNFNSYCVYENRAFAANDTGIYELTGNTDDGDTIHTGTILSATDFGSPNQKRFRRGYLGISGNNPMMILETEDGTRQAFNIDTQGKTVISSALKSKKWKLSLADFNTVDHIKLIPVILTK